MTVSMHSDKGNKKMPEQQQYSISQIVVGDENVNRQEQVRERSINEFDQ